MTTPLEAMKQALEALKSTHRALSYPENDYHGMERSKAITTLTQAIKQMEKEKTEPVEEWLCGIEVAAIDLAGMLPSQQMAHAASALCKAISKKKWELLRPTTENGYWRQSDYGSTEGVPLYTKDYTL